MTESGWERRRRLIERGIEATALDLFAVDGFDTVTVDQIARGAGISERTFFRYFPAKEDLLWARAKRTMDLLPDHLAARPPHEPLLVALERASHSMMDTFTDELDAWLMWANIVRAALASGRVSVRPEHEFPVPLTEVIALRIGDSPHDLRPGVLAAAIMAALQFAFLRWVSGGGHADFSSLMDDAIRSLASLEQLDVAAVGKD